MPVLAFLNSKGGSGKTTISVHVARELQKRKQRVLLIDSDTQGSALDWSAVTEGEYFSVVGIDRPVLENEVKKLSGDYDWIIIDGAAKAEKMIVSTIKAADFIIMPVKPSPLDVWAISGLVDAIKARQEITDGMPAAAFLISQSVKGTLLEADVLKALDDYELQTFTTLIHNKQAYPKAMAIGKTALETDGGARFEISNLTDEIIEAFQ